MSTSVYNARERLCRNLEIVTCCSFPSDGNLFELMPLVRENCVDVFVLKFIARDYKIKIFHEN